MNQYQHLKKTHSFDNCKLDRKAFAEFLFDYITTQLDGFVLNLNGEWGSGKTEFLKRLYSYSSNQGHPTIYIDAWESDFSKNPLAVIASELLNQIDELNDSIGDDYDFLKKNFGNALRGTLVGATGFLSKSLLGDASYGTEAAKYMLQLEDSKGLFEKLSSEYAEQISSIKEIRKNLASCADTLASNKGANLPVIVLIDELDRCRPDYAIELLEVVKHFFTTQNFVFVIASDTRQLSLSIKTIYGNEFESDKYLKRFFHREAKLPEPDLYNYLTTIGIDCSKFFTSDLICPMCNISEEKTEELIFKLITAYTPHLRDADQILAKLQSAIITIVKKTYSSPKPHYIDLFVLTISICEHHIGLADFEKREDIPGLKTSLTQAKLLVEEGFQISILAEFSLACSAVHQEGYKDLGTTYYRPALIDSREFQNFSRRSNSRLFNEISNAYGTSINSLQNNIPQLWQWKEYKGIAELTSTLS